MMRSKKVRTVLSRCRMVMVAKGLPVLPRRLTSQRLKSSMWGRPMCATETQLGSNSLTRWAKKRSVSSAAATVPGRADTSSGPGRRPWWRP